MAMRESTGRGGAEGNGNQPEQTALKETVEGLRKFRQKFEADRTFYQRLAETQQPKFFWIGCSDSRVVPDLITSALPGKLFVVRNIANIVPPAGSPDASVGAALEFAILQLNVDDIVVCGHTGCGGVQAMLAKDAVREPNLKRWIAYGRIGAAANPEDASKANILAQRDNLLTYAFIRERVEAGTLALHGWLYDMTKGDLLAYDEEADAWRSLSA
jgi:carbonic anhydrase